MSQSDIINKNFSDLKTKKQDTLVSGTNIKTINNESILGEGNLEIQSSSYYPPILSCMWSDHLINDQSWLRADTFSWQSGDVYKTVYDKLVEEYTNSKVQYYSWKQAGTGYICFTLSSTPSVGDDIYYGNPTMTPQAKITSVTATSITFSTGTFERNSADDNLGFKGEVENNIVFVRTTSGFKITSADSESAVLSKYNTEGIAWYYILDTTNKRFKLPRTKFGFEGLRTNVGDDIAESLPNIKGALSTYVDLGRSNGTGAIRRVNDGTKFIGTDKSTSGTQYAGFDFDASRSSSTYKDNAPVQERATQMYLYFYVGEFAQTSIEQTAGLNAELFNGKMDLSLLQVIYPVGSIYLSVNSTCPLAGLFGTWERVAEGKALWTGNGSNGGTTISAGLPDIYGAANSSRNSFVGTWNVGAFSRTVHNSQNWSIGGEGTWQGNYGDGIIFYASSSNSIYGNSSTVQPPSYVINAFRRVS